MPEAEMALKRYLSEFSGIRALCIYGLSKKHGRVIDEDSAITTDSALRQVVRLAFLYADCDVTFLLRITHNSELLRKPENARMNITKFLNCKRSSGIVSAATCLRWWVFRGSFLLNIS